MFELWCHVHEKHTPDMGRLVQRKKKLFIWEKVAMTCL